MRPSDLPRFCDHLLRLDRESRRDRFNGPADDEFVVAYAERSFAEGTTVVGYVEDDQVFGAAELHERPEEPEPTAEIAFSVERAFQNRGIGGRLFERLILHALGLGYSKLCVTTHPQNAAMKALARRFNAKLSFEEGETVGVIQLHPVLDAIPDGMITLRRDSPAASDAGAGQQRLDSTSRPLGIFACRARCL